VVRVSSPKASAGVAARWRQSFLNHLEDGDTAEALREAAIEEHLSDWTSLLTTVVVRSCGELGWPVAAKGHPLTLLPQPGQEYLGMDVMAFSEPVDSGGGSLRWPAPLAVFELENSPRDDRVAYSLWKVLSVRAKLHVVIAYRHTWELAAALPNRVASDVLRGLQGSSETDLAEVVFVVGSRSDGESFPWGYFKFWRLDHGVGRFTKLS
jgi:hypothetical protein